MSQIGPNPAYAGEPMAGIEIVMHPNVLNKLCEAVHRANQRWWHDPATGASVQRNVGEMLALVHSEISEALEGDRKNLMDDKLPDIDMFTVELADAVIRIFDIAGAHCPRFGEAFVRKMAYNAVRVDHTNEARLAEGGKKY